MAKISLSKKGKMAKISKKVKKKKHENWKLIN